MTTHTVTDLSSFLDWRRAIDEKDRALRQAEIWFFTNVAVVLLAEKAGELLNLDLSELGLPVDTIESIIARRCEEWGLAWCTLLRGEDTIKLVVYRPERVNRQLAEVPPCVLHGRLDYPAGLDAARFLELVAERWNRTGTIPHEIGFALGYGIDDVLGYMGLAPLECKGFCGWQVFGDWEEAQRRRCIYREARCRALHFVAA